MPIAVVAVSHLGLVGRHAERVDLLITADPAAPRRHFGSPVAGVPLDGFARVNPTSGPDRAEVVLCGSSAAVAQAVRGCRGLAVLFVVRAATELDAVATAALDALRKTGRTVELHRIEAPSSVAFRLGRKAIERVAESEAVAEPAPVAEPDPIAEPVEPIAVPAPEPAPAPPKGAARAPRKAARADEQD